MKKITILLSIIFLVHLSDLSAQRKSARTSNSDKKSENSASPVKVLMEQSGTSEKDCEIALKEAGGNIDIALLKIQFPGASIEDCKKALSYARGNVDKAKAELDNKYKIDNRDSNKNKKNKKSARKNRPSKGSDKKSTKSARTSRPSNDSDKILTSSARKEQCGGLCGYVNFEGKPPKKKTIKQTLRKRGETCHFWRT